MLVLKTVLVVLLFTIPTSGISALSQFFGFIFTGILLFSITFREIWGWEEEKDNVRLYRSYLFGWTAIRGRPYLAFFSQKSRLKAKNKLTVNVDSIHLDIKLSQQIKTEHCLSWTHPIYLTSSRFVQWMFPYGNFALHITLLIIAGGFLEGQIFWVTAFICSILYWGISYYLHEFSKDLREEIVQNITNVILGLALLGIILYLLGEWALATLGTFFLLMILATYLAKASGALSQSETDSIVLLLKYGNKIGAKVEDLIDDLPHSERYVELLAQEDQITLASYNSRNLESQCMAMVLQDSPIFHQIGDSYKVNLTIL